MNSRQHKEHYSFLGDSGEMSGLISNYDWDKTKLGNPGHWPQSLRLSLTNALNTRFPMFIFWGDDLTCFYNDAFRPSLGIDGKHPAIGKNGAEVWSEIWDFTGPLINGVLSTGKAVWFENQLLSFYRNGQLEETYWTFSYSLLVNDDGGPGGVLVTCMETTEQILARKISDVAHNKLESLLSDAPMVRNMIEQAPIALALTRGEDFIFESINAPMLEIISRKEANEVLGKSLKKVIPELVSQPVFEILSKVLKTGETFQGTEVEAELAKDGVLQRKFFDITYSRIIDSNGIPCVLHMANDVTGQVTIRRKAEESEAKLRSILNSAPTAMGVFVGPDLIVENPNQLLIDVMAAGPDIEGKSFRKLLSGLVDEDQSFIQLIDTVRSTGQPFEAQEIGVFFKAEEITRYFNISFIPLLDDNGNVYAVLDVSVNVTEQVLARKKLEESEGRFRLLADASPTLIWMLNPDGSYNYVNKTTLEFLGVTQEQIARSGWAHFLHPDDLSAATLAIASAVQSSQPYETEHRLRHKNGEYRWLLSRANPAYDALGKVFAYVGISIDIHEGKISRQHLQTALEQARLSKEAAELGTFDIEMKTWNMHWDDRCRVLFGISHHNPVSYEQDFLERLHPGDRQRISDAVNRAFKKSLTNGDYDVEYRTIGAEDGLERWVKAKGKVYFDGNDHPIRFIGSVLDITVQKTAIQEIEKTVELRTRELAQANESLQVINKELQRSNQNLEEFAYAASHDLKEPVRKIHVFTNHLKRQLSNHLSESEAKSFTRIENATIRMADLIDDLLLYSHVSHRPHQKEPVDLNEQIQRVLEDLELEIEDKKASIVVEKLPVIPGYPRQLQQLLQNLVNNSLKYSKTDLAPKIIISAKQVIEEGNRYDVISVKDNGIGFESEYAGKIFQMFTRLHAKGEYSGTGVGLSIVKKVIENHHGFIRVESVPGEGSTFRSYFPAT